MIWPHFPNIWTSVWTPWGVTSIGGVASCTTSVKKINAENGMFFGGGGGGRTSGSRKGCQNLEKFEKMVSKLLRIRVLTKKFIGHRSWILMGKFWLWSSSVVRRLPTVSIAIVPPPLWSEPSPLPMCGEDSRLISALCTTTSLNIVSFNNLKISILKNIDLQAGM